MTSRSRVAGRPKKGPIALSKVKTRTLYIGCPGSNFPSPAIAKNKNPKGVPIKRELSTAGNMANPVDMFVSSQGTSHASLELAATSLIGKFWGWEPTNGTGDSFFCSVDSCDAIKCWIQRVGQKSRWTDEHVNLWAKTSQNGKHLGGS